jgi:opacity protein-like surface antigen
MPTFIKVHNAVQQYLSGIYGKLPMGTNESNLIGTLIGKHTNFINQLKNEIDSFSTISHKSFGSVKKDLRNAALFFLTPSTSLVINKKLGNTVQFDLGFELKIKRALIGYSFGFGFNTTDPNYIAVYNDKELKPSTRLNWTYNAWYNYLLLKECFINPYIGGGFGLQEGFGSRDIGNYNNVQIAITTAQLYPEVGLLLGNWPNYIVKLNCSYRLSAVIKGAYYGDIQEEELTLIDNLNVNSWRIGFTVLVGMQKRFNKKAKLVGLL